MKRVETINYLYNVTKVKLSFCIYPYKDDHLAELSTFRNKKCDRFYQLNKEIYIFRYNL